MNALSVHTQFPQPKMLSPVRNKLEEIIFESLQQRLLNEVTDYNDKWPANVPTGWTNKAAENFLKSVGAFAKNIGSNAAGLDKVYGPFYEVYYNASYNPGFLINTTAIDLKNPIQKKLTNTIQFYKETLRFYKNGEVKFVSGGIDPLTGKQRNSPRLAGWSFSNNEIQIYEEADDHSNPMGKFEKIGNKLSFVMDAAQAKKAKNTVKGDDDWSIKDSIRLGLDIIGFIPFYGDIADLGQAFWYFYDYTQSGDIWDFALCLLSLIGAIPLVGSIVSSGGKGIVKTLSLAKETALIKGNLLTKIFEHIGIMKKLDASQVGTIIGGYHPMVTNFTKLKVFLAEQLGRTKFTKLLDEVSDELVAGEKFLQDLKRNAEVKKGQGPAIKPKGSTAKALDTTGDAVYNPKTGKYEIPELGTERFLQYSYGRAWLESLSSLTYERQATKITSAVDDIANKAAGTVKAAGIPGVGVVQKVIKFLKQAMFWSMSSKQLNHVVKSLTDVFQKATLEDPDKLLLLIRSTPKSQQVAVLEPLYKLLKKTPDFNINSVTFTDTWTRYLRELSVANPAQHTRILRSTPETISKLKQVLFNSHNYRPLPSTNDGVSQLLTQLRQTPETVSAYGKMAQNIAKEAIKNGHPIWNSLLSSPWVTLKAYGSKAPKMSDIIPGTSNLISLLAKQIAHEGKEIYFKMGASNEGDARGLLSKYFAEEFKEHSAFLQKLAEDSIGTITPVTTSSDPLVVPEMPKATTRDNTSSKTLRVTPKANPFLKTL